MTSNPTGWQPTSRDNDILSALELLPLTAEQLLKWSERFDQPFTQIGDLRRRLRKLHAAGLINRWPLAIESRGSLPYYHKLSPTGFDFLKQQTDIRPERKRSFAPIGLALHAHTKALSEFIVHTAVDAHRLGAAFVHLFPENAYSVQVGEESLRLDWRYSLSRGEVRRTYNVELDNSTESVLTSRDTDSIARKIRLLDAHDAQYKAVDSRRAITLFVTTRSQLRLENILDAAATLLRNPNRSLIYGVYLPDYLATGDALTSPSFLDHRGRRVALLPKNTIQSTPPSIAQLAVPAPA